MLTRNEYEVLMVISENSVNGNSCLLSLKEIEELLKNSSKINVQKVLDDLYEKEYVDIVYTERKGTPVYCITVLKKGKNFKREKRSVYSALRFKIILAVVSAVVSFLVGKFLIFLFK